MTTNRLLRPLTIDHTTTPIAGHIDAPTAVTR